MTLMGNQSLGYINSLVLDSVVASPPTYLMNGNVQLYTLLNNGHGGN